MLNQEIAQIFRKISEILELKDENPFRIRAYLRAAQNIENLTEDIQVLVEGKRLKIPGIGQDLAGKIEEIVKTGKLEFYEKLKKTIPLGLLEILNIPGVGPKKAKLLYDKLGIDSVPKLETAAKNHKLREIFGLKEKTEENILQGIAFLKQAEERILLSTAMAVAGEIINQLKKLKEIKQIFAAGSLRRRKETIRDIDILATASSSRKIMDVFCSLPQANKVLAKGKTKSAILIKDGIQVDVRVVKPDSFGAAMCYFTGSKAHNIRIRDLAKRKGLKINEYGVFEEKTKRRIAGKEEKDIYQTLKLDYIEPELREDRGEIEAAQEHKLPKLVTPNDIKSDLHIHSKWSDGMLTIEEIAKFCQGLGYEYMVITDHSQSLGIARGLTPQSLSKQIEEIKSLDKKMKNFRILCGAEVDIKADGSLDFADDTLKKLDVVLAAIHSGFKQSQEQLTSRILKAMQNRFVNIIVHPFGRLIGERAAYELDFDKILKMAKKTNTALEINAYAKRLDLDDIHVRRVKELGVRLAIGTDSHTAEQLKMMSLGVFVARRSWLEKKDVLNCFSCDEFLMKIKK